MEKLTQEEADTLRKALDVYVEYAGRGLVSSEKRAENIKAATRQVDALRAKLMALAK